MSCSGTIQNLEGFWIRSDNVSNDVQRLGEGLERFGGSGAVWGRSAECPKTLARSVEMWGARAAVRVWLLWGDP